MNTATFSKIFKALIVLLIEAWLFDYPRATSVLMGLILSMGILGILKRRDKISMIDLLAGATLTLAAVLLVRHNALMSGLTGTVLGIIICSYVLAPGSSSLRHPLGRTLGILIGAVGSYFVSYCWAELLVGVLTGFLFTGLLFSLPRQPRQAVSKTGAR